jgi:hypothetical protein
MAAVSIGVDAAADAAFSEPLLIFNDVQIWRTCLAGGGSLEIRPITLRIKIQ